MPNFPMKMPETIDPTLFESPLEEKFASQIIRYLNNNVCLKNQVEFETVCGIFRIDFVAETDGRKIAIECDGKNYHGGSAQIYDSWRDIVILAEKHVDIIYRLQLPNRKRDIQKCLKSLFQLEPAIFDEIEGLNLDATTVKSISEVADNIKVKSSLPPKHQKIYEFICGNSGRRLNPLIYEYHKKFGDYGINSKLDEIRRMP